MKQIRLNLSVLLILSSLFILPVNGQNKELAKYIEDARQSFGVPGIAVGIIKDGKIIMSQGFGYRNADTKEKTDDHTIFGIASCSKAFTAACIGILVDEGKLAWDDKVIDYLPEFRMYDPCVTAEFQVQDLLCHRSGLQTFDGDLLWYGTNYSRQEIIRRIRFRKPSYSFRSQFGYQNVMFIVAGQLIESVSGQSWDDFLKEHFFDALDMTASNTSNSGLTKEMDIAYPHIDGKPLDFINYDNAGPAASINTSVSDLLKWVDLWLNKGKHGEKQIFSEKSYYDLTAPHTLLPAGKAETVGGTHFSAYGMGWFLNDLNGHKIIQHGGGLPGFHSKVVLVPEENLGFVIVANQLSGLVESVYKKILDDFVTHEGKDWASIYRKYESRRDRKNELADSLWIAQRQSNTNPSLPLEKYTGKYSDTMYGDALIERKDKSLWITLLPTGKLFTGELRHWQYNTFKVEFIDPFLPAAYVTFNLDEEGSVNHFTIKLDNPDFHFYKLDFSKQKE